MWLPCLKPSSGFYCLGVKTQLLILPAKPGLAWPGLAPACVSTLTPALSPYSSLTSVSEKFPGSPGLMAAPQGAPSAWSIFPHFLQVFPRHLLLVIQILPAWSFFSQKPSLIFLSMLCHQPLFPLQILWSIVHCLSEPLECKLYTSRDLFPSYSLCISRVFSSTWHIQRTQTFTNICWMDVY